MKIEYKSINDLIPYVNNTRTHSEEQVKQIASSIKEFGFTNPILIDEQCGIIAGHGRVMGANKLGFKEVPTITLNGLSEAQKKAYIIADNKIALNAGWDEDLLQLELISLDEMGFDYSNLGFDFDFDIEEIQDEINKQNLKEQDYREKFEIIIECDNELQQEQIYYDLNKKGYKCRVQSL